MAGEHAERGRRTDYLARRRHVRVRRRLLGCRRPIRLIFGKSWTCPDRALLRPYLVPGPRSSSPERHSRRAFGGRLSLCQRLLGRRDAKRLALGQPGGALRHGIPLDGGQHPHPQGELFAVACQPLIGQCWAVGSSSDFRRESHSGSFGVGGAT